jgi:hypothetical protein
MPNLKETQASGRGWPALSHDAVRSVRERDHEHMMTVLHRSDIAVYILPYIDRRES